MGEHRYLRVGFGDLRGRSGSVPGGLRTNVEAYATTRGAPMNTKHTGRSDGASDSGQEHRGPTNQTTKAVRTMDQTSTIIETSGQVRPGASGFPAVCWCGQDLEYV